MREAICHITTVHGPFDPRIFQKECRSAVRSGFEVYEVAPHDCDEVVDGVTVLAIPRYENRLRRMVFGPWRAFQRAFRTGASVCHFHDPELIPAGILLALMRRKVIYDAHENLPAQIRSKDWIRPALLRPVVGWLAGLLEKFGALFFSRVIGVTEEIAQRFGRKGVLIRNLPVLQLADSALVSSEPKDKPVVIFSGGLFRVKGVCQLIRAFQYLEGEAELWLLGTWESPAFRASCQALSGFRSVRYLGRVNPNEVFSYMKQAEIGACTFLPVPNNLESLPNKILEYLACGVPAVISDFPYWRRHFSEGVAFVDPLSPKDIADKIRHLLSHSAERKTLGIRGKRLVSDQRTWEAEEKNLFELYGKVLQP
jgi:glycosyltransferase involved in cell wall biosynthesis